MVGLNGVNSYFRTAVYYSHTYSYINGIDTIVTWMFVLLKQKGYKLYLCWGLKGNWGSLVIK